MSLVSHWTSHLRERVLLDYPHSVATDIYTLASRQSGGDNVVGMAIEPTMQTFYVETNGKKLKITVEAL